MEIFLQLYGAFSELCIKVPFLSFLRVHDVSQGCCRSQFPTILSLLKIENVNVFNCLVDQKKVEKVIIMDDEHVAQNLLMSVQTAPRNLLYSLALNKNNGNISQYYPAPSYKTYAVNQNRRNLGKLQTSVAEHLERLNTELEACRDELEKVILRLRPLCITTTYLVLPLVLFDSFGNFRLIRIQTKFFLYL